MDDEWGINGFIVDTVKPIMAMINHSVIVWRW